MILKREAPRGNRSLRSGAALNARRRAVTRLRTCGTAARMPVLMLTALAAGGLPGWSGAMVFGQSTLRVPADYATIQAAIDAAADGDTVLVAPGTYVERIDFGGKAITVEGAEGPDVTTIDGNEKGPVVTFENGEDWNSVLRGFTITNGWVRNLGFEFDAGAGIFIRGASPLLEDLQVVENSIDRNVPNLEIRVYGAGIYAEESAFILRDSRVAENRVPVLYDVLLMGGGAIYCVDCSARIEWTELEGVIQTSGSGGALYVTGRSDVAVTGSTVVGDIPYSSGKGGSIFISGPSLLVVVSSLIDGSTWGQGLALYAIDGAMVMAADSTLGGSGGEATAWFSSGAIGWFSACTLNGSWWGELVGTVYSADTLMTFEDCIIRGGFADEAGGMLLKRCDLEIIGSTFSDNWGYFGGQFVAVDCGRVIIEHSTFERGDKRGAYSDDMGGGAVRLDNVTEAVIRNSTFIDNMSDAGGAIRCLGSTVLLENLSFEENQAELGADVSVRGGAVVARNLLSVHAFLEVPTFGQEWDWGGAIAIEGDATFDGEFITIGRMTIEDRRTLADIDGVGLIAVSDGLVHIRHAIIRPEQSEYDAPTIYTRFGTPLQIDYSNLDGGWDGFGEGNFDLEPAFVDPDAGDYRLKIGSPNINAGNPAFVPDPNAVDLDGNPRRSSCIVDVGAYEAAMDAYDAALTLTQPVRGERATLRLTCAEPGEEVIFFISGAGTGIGPAIPALGNLRLDILDPVREVGRAIADDDGVAILTGRIRPNLGWRGLYIQAGIARGLLGSESIKSNVAARRVFDP